MSQDRPPSHLAIAVGAVTAGGVAMLVMFALSVGVTIRFVVLLPWLLGAIALYHTLRAQSLPAARSDEIEDRGRRALHFSIFSLSISAVFVVIVLMAVWFMSSGG